MKLSAFIALAIVTLFPLFDCASHTIKMVSYNSRLLDNADSLFKSGNFDEADKAYTKIRQDHPKTDEAKTAFFQSAYLNIYYKNTNPNLSEALRKFKSFISQYPNDSKLTGQAESWCRILTIIQSYKTHARSSVDQVERLKYLKDDALHSQKNILDSMAVVIRNCFESRETYRDSLTKANTKLENVIIDLEKKCQQVGR